MTISQGCSDVLDAAIMSGPSIIYVATMRQHTAAVTDYYVLIQSTKRLRFGTCEIAFTLLCLAEKKSLLLKITSPDDEVFR